MLPLDDFKILKKYCDTKKILFLSTPFCEESIDFLEPLVSAYKIASGDLVSHSFLKKIAAKKKPLILSTGMGTLQEIEEAIEIISTAKNTKLIILHCTTNYPCAFEEVNLRAMQTIQKTFKIFVGYSDHTKGILVSQLAVAMGARIIEKHLTLNKNLPGPDHKASLDPHEFKQMVTAIRTVELCMGTGVKKPALSELRMKKSIRKSIIAVVDIPKQTTITKKMLTTKRPGTGIEPKYMRNVIGSTAKKKIKQDEIITWKKIVKKN